MIYKNKREQIGEQGETLINLKEKSEHYVAHTKSNRKRISHEVEWWSGGMVEWWNGGMVEWWNGVDVDVDTRGGVCCNKKKDK